MTGDKQMRRFLLVRHVDPSGVSGTGVVAQGVEFGDGTVALRWECTRPATAVWDDIDDMISTHGHSGCTEIRWVDPLRACTARERTPANAG